MLTPQGLKGKQYRVTGTAYPRLGRPPRRSRKVLAVIGSLLALALIGLGGVQLVDIFSGKFKHASAQACASPSTTVSGKPLAAPAADAPPGAPGTPPGTPGTPAADPHAVPQPQNVTVNVYNATAKAGLAARTADELKKRGFVIGKVGNAPTALDKKVPGTAQVVGGPAAAGAMTLLTSQIAGATSTPDARTDASVDFVIGDSYNALLDETQAAAALALATKPSPTATTNGSC